MSSTPDDRVAIAIGAGTGVGAAVARSVSIRGQTAALVGRQREPLEAAAAGPGRGLVVVADPADAEAPRRVVDAVPAKTGRLAVLVNNAASLHLKEVGEVSPDDFDAMVALNLRAPYFLVRESPTALRRRPRRLS